jgi:hypothetical protein
MTNIRELVTYYHRGSVSYAKEASTALPSQRNSHLLPHIESSITAMSENIVTNKSARSTTDTDNFPPQRRSPILYLSAGLFSFF